MNQEAATDLGRLKKNALFLVWVGEIWNMVKAAVALWSGTAKADIARPNLQTGIAALIEVKIMATLFIMCGLPFSGKTYLSKKIAERFGIKRISYDELWKEIHDNEGHDPNWEELCAIIITPPRQIKTIDAERV